MLVGSVNFIKIKDEVMYVKNKIAIIGAGAAGMIAALTASEKKNNQIFLIEKQERVGKKIMFTGNGHCNLSNINLNLKFYHGQNKKFAKYALEHFNPYDLINFFSGIGLECQVMNDGKVYPYSHQAGSVVDILRFALDKPNIELLTNHEVKGIKKVENKFTIVYDEGKKIYADKVIITAGGVAATQIGGTYSGYEILKSLGHSCTKLIPSLVQLKTDTKYTKALKGIKVDALISCDDQKSFGEILFTDYGISGSAIFSISRCVTSKSYPHVISVDFMSDKVLVELISILQAKKKIFLNLTVENFLTGILNKRVGQMILRSLGYKLSKKISELIDQDISCIAQTIKHFEIKVTGDLGFRNAQVTAGGISTFEFDDHTMQSKKCAGLYAAGEVLDIDGDCGGYNLQWAFASGRLAGYVKKGDMNER